MSAPPVDTPRLFAGVRADGAPLALDEHLARWGTLPHLDARALIGELDEAGLVGLGGAGFPTARKLAAVASQVGRPVVVANGTEGEAASSKDKVLLRCVPHLVLDGASLAAAALGAEEAIIAVGVGARRELEVVRNALAERQRARNDRTPLRLVAAPDGFVAGEETALVSFLDGGPPRPTFVPPRPYERGIRGRPTLVQNVETLANVASIARFGAAWFRGLGTPEEPGSVLVTLSGALRRPGVYEAPRGLPLRELLDWAGGVSTPLSALLVGGYFGTWIPAADVDSLSLLESELRAAGSALGARAIVALPETTCGVVETARVARYLSSASAGQCGPCVHGLAAIAGALEKLARGHGDDAAHLPRWLAQVDGRGACAHPDGSARFVASARRVFAREFALHAQGRCSGGGRPVLPLPAAVRS